MSECQHDWTGKDVTRETAWIPPARRRPETVPTCAKCGMSFEMAVYLARKRDDAPSTA